jgi:hypothetical protein
MDLTNSSRSSSVSISLCAVTSIGTHVTKLGRAFA